MVVPVELAVTTPVVLLMVATAVLLLLQVPPDAELERVADAPLQRVVAPLIVPADGIEFTVTSAVSVAVPQLPLTL